MKLLLVSIGVLEKGRAYVDETGFPAEDLYADPENACYDALALYKGWGRTFLSPATPFSFLERFQKDGAEDMRALLPGWKPWIPPKADQGLQQGGLLVFDGQDALYFHRDEGTGAHADFEKVVRIATAGLPTPAPAPAPARVEGGGAE